jgi:hypothetical protein
MYQSVVEELWMDTSGIVETMEERNVNVSPLLHFLAPNRERNQGDDRQDVDIKGLFGVPNEQR